MTTLAQAAQGATLLLAGGSFAAAASLGSARVRAGVRGRRSLAGTAAAGERSPGRIRLLGRSRATTLHLPVAVVALLAAGAAQAGYAVVHAGSSLAASAALVAVLRYAAAAVMALRPSVAVAGTAAALQALGLAGLVLSHVGDGLPLVASGPSPWRPLDPVLAAMEGVAMLALLCWVVGHRRDPAAARRTPPWRSWHPLARAWTVACLAVPLVAVVGSRTTL